MVFIRATAQIGSAQCTFLVPRTFAVNHLYPSCYSGGFIGSFQIVKDLIVTVLESRPNHQIKLILCSPLETKCMVIAYYHTIDLIFCNVFRSNKSLLEGLCIDQVYYDEKFS